MKKPLIAVTMGDPAGVGPELCVRALASATVRRVCDPVVFGDAAVLAAAARRCRLPFRATTVGFGSFADGIALRGPTVVDCNALRGAPVKPGVVSARCGRASFLYIGAGVEAVLAGQAAALVTAPISKEALHRAGIRYPGHTEMLADMTGAKSICMTMASPELVVSLVTTHTPYATVPRLLTARRILEVISLTDRMLRRCGRRRPRIAVCALNPHAGEGGLFGREEQRIIGPAVRAARRRGFAVTGPLPPDTAFVPARRRATDAYVVMQHDQGLIPFKMLAFDHGTNMTLGLPIVRTSVDHGTAFDIAWKGIADAGSLVESIRWAVRLQRGAGKES